MFMFEKLYPLHSQPLAELKVINAIMIFPAEADVQTIEGELTLLELFHQKCKD